MMRRLRLLFPALLLGANAMMSLDSRGWRLAYAALAGVLLFSPLYLFLYHHRLLCLMALPEVLLIFVLLFAAARLQAQTREAGAH